ncbi:MAG: oligosaccharide flippase family protein [Chloroflexi bacterium]|nr:oligosaccharide flippase family protein [Chloroflexota bacterium]
MLRPELVRDLFGYGVQLYVPAVVQYLHYRLDVLLVAGFLSPREVGLYSLAVTLAELLRRVPGAVSPLLFPRVARLPDRQGMALTLSSCRHVSFLLILLALPFALGVGFVVTPLLGARYEGLRAPALALLPGIVAVGIVQLLILHFFARGRPGLVLGSVSVGLAANLALNLLWIPRWGILGAALASTASYGLCAALLVMVLLAREDARLRDVFVLRRGDWRVYADLWRRRSWRGAAAPGGREAA